MKQNHPTTQDKAVNFLVWLLIVGGAIGIVASYIRFRQGARWGEVLFIRGSISIVQTGIGFGLCMVLGIIILLTRRRSG
jgi:hypothetical protein